MTVKHAHSRTRVLRRLWVHGLLLLTFVVGGSAMMASTAPAYPGPVTAEKKGGAPAEGVININEASAAELSYLPGIGLRKAERIADFRTKRPFRRVTQLARVKGIGVKTIRQLRRWLRVKGPTTLSGPLKIRK